MAVPGTTRVRRHARSMRVALIVLAAGSSVLLLVHAGVQGVGALEFWGPCWSDGYESDACSYLQYEAPTPGWVAPIWVWAAEVGLAVAVLVLARATDSRSTMAALAVFFVLASSILVDYVLTPAVNGGYVSADSPPGAGLIGATAMAVGGTFMLVVALPRRMPPEGGSPRSPDGMR